MRQSLIQQDKCHGLRLAKTPFFGRKFTSTTKISHGLASVRTLWCKRQRLTVTLKVPTFPLPSNARNEIVCSPAPVTGSSIE
jgi:hypothetical protein